jgi:hypothetical protein
MSVTKSPPIESRWPFGNFSSALSSVRKHRNGNSASQQERPSSSAKEPVVKEPGPAKANEATMKDVISDVLLAALWGAMIPGLMWLGYAAGF